MTDSRAFRHTAAAIFLIPATAGLFGASVAWAGANDPLPAASTSTAQPVAPTTDTQLADLTAQVLEAQARVVALQEVVAAQASAKVQAQADAAAQAAAAQAAAAQAAAAATTRTPARAPAPAVQAVTKASG